MTRRESLWSRHPDYRVDLEPRAGRVRAVYGGTTVAESERALLVRETRHEPVVYFPRDDVRLEHLERTEHGSFCPFKGEASYWSLRDGDARAANAAWSYEDPFPEVAGLQGYVAFYPDRVRLEEG
jgi:uncharacterized protein (DUF427 family)